MENSRRSFFATLLAPLVARFIPRNTLLDSIDDGINSEWDGTISEAINYSAANPSLDQINAVTCKYLANSPLPDMIFAQSPFFEYLNRKQRILDAGGSIVGQFGRMPGEPWRRLGSGLTLVVPRLPI